MSVFTHDENFLSLKTHVSKSKGFWRLSLYSCLTSLFFCLIFMKYFLHLQVRKSCWERTNSWDDSWLWGEKIWCVRIIFTLLCIHSPHFSFPPWPSICSSPFSLTLLTPFHYPHHSEISLEYIYIYSFKFTDEIILWNSHVESLWIPRYWMPFIVQMPPSYIRCTYSYFVFLQYLSLVEFWAIPVWETSSG